MPREVHTGREAGENIAKVLHAGGVGVHRDLDALGTKLVSELRIDLSTPGEGALYTTRFFTDRNGIVHPYGTRPPHRASLPGRAPAVDTGVLRASYGHTVTRVAYGAILAIGTSKDYAAYLEFGTTKMEPRPHLRPLIARNWGTIRAAVADGVEGRERAMNTRLGGRP